MIYTLQGDYGHGWEDVTSETTAEEIAARRKEYEENEGGRYRVIKEREANDD